MEDFYYILAYCRISKNFVLLDDEIKLHRKENELESEFIKRIYQQLAINYPKFHKMDLLCKIPFLATEFIGKSCSLQNSDTALFFSNKSSSWISDDLHAKSIFNEPYIPSPAVFVYTLPNIVLGEISIRNQLLSENLFLIFEQFSAENYYHYTTELLQNKHAEMVLCGWVEITENQWDVFVYLVGKNGKTKHTIENINNLYQKK